MINEIDISPTFKGALSLTDLLKPQGKLQVFPSDIKKANYFLDSSGYFFKVVGENFNFKLSIDETGLYLERNGEECVLTPDMLPNKELKFFIVTWSPTRIRLISMDNDKNQIAAIKYTMPCSVPQSLKRWAREKSLIPKKSYESEIEFRNAVYQCLSDLKSKIEDNGSEVSFWDYLYDGNKIKSKQPKKETLVQPLMKTIIDTELYTRGIDVFRENTTTAGDIDFTVVGHVEGVGIVNMCIELKNAHSKYLENGLLNQLPDYMRSQNAQYGAYCVLNYNIENGDKIDRGKLLGKLTYLHISSNDDLVRTKIRTFIIDLDRKIIDLKKK